MHRINSSLHLYSLFCWSIWEPLKACLCQLSQTVQESPTYKYGTDLWLSNMGHQIFQQENTFKLLSALVWNLAHFLIKTQIFLFIEPSSSISS